MKTFTIDIHPKLKDVEITVPNGAKFTRDSRKGSYATHRVVIAEKDVKRVKQFAVKNGNDNNSNYGNWYAHCNGYAMGLFINYLNECNINTYRPYGRA